MNDWIVPITVALIGGPLMFFLRRLDKNNTNQHLSNSDALQDIKTSISEVKSDVKEVKTDVRDIRTRLDNHIQWHLDSQKGENE